MNTNEKVIDTICHIRHYGDRYDMCQDMRSWVAERNGLIQDLLKAKKEREGFSPQKKTSMRTPS
ncbi:phage protein [Streptococcus pyogenes]|nr:phage protein [Streptococcus pyogenes]VGS10553.1 phage protein [Streptococcus pyogenes]VGS74110.1 phage protein [Streptococcus pyogenes]